jgi:hypothetical protein
MNKITFYSDSACTHPVSTTVAPTNNVCSAVNMVTFDGFSTLCSTSLTGGTFSGFKATIGCSTNTNPTYSIATGYGGSCTNMIAGSGFNSLTTCVKGTFSYNCNLTPFTATYYFDVECDYKTPSPTVAPTATPITPLITYSIGSNSNPYTVTNGVCKTVAFGGTVQSTKLTCQTSSNSVGVSWKQYTSSDCSGSAFVDQQGNANSFTNAFLIGPQSNAMGVFASIQCGASPTPTSSPTRFVVAYSNDNACPGKGNQLVSATIAEGTCVFDSVLGYMKIACDSQSETSNYQLYCGYTDLNSCQSATGPTTQLLASNTCYNIGNGVCGTGYRGFAAYCSGSFPRTALPTVVPTPIPSFQPTVPPTAAPTAILTVLPTRHPTVLSTFFMVEAASGGSSSSSGGGAAGGIAGGVVAGVVVIGAVVAFLFYRNGWKMPEFNGKVAPLPGGDGELPISKSMSIVPGRGEGGRQMAAKAVVAVRTPQQQPATDVVVVQAKVLQHSNHHSNHHHHIHPSHADDDEDCESFNMNDLENNSSERE